MDKHKDGYFLQRIDEPADEPTDEPGLILV